MKYIFGVDIGGMSVKIGLVDLDGKILLKETVITDRNPAKLVEDVANIINEMLIKCNLSFNDVLGVGVGCPGMINSEKGTVDCWENLDWLDVELVSMLNEKLGVPVRLSNDANAAIMAEVVWGAAKNYKNAIMLTLGTGVGGGVVIDGKLFEGGEGKGTELGHITIVKDGIYCNCGRKGCLEVYASATALMNQTKDAMLEDKSSLMWKLANGSIDNVNGKIPFEASKQGDISAIKVVDKYVEYLSDGIMSLLNIFRPEVVLVGGGVSGAGDYLINKIKAYCEKYYYGMNKTPVPEIKVASLGNDAGILGAASLIM